MAKKKREAAGGVNNIKRRVVILIAVAAMAVCSLVVVRGVLLANAQKMGNEIAHSYSVENTRNLIGYETMLHFPRTDPELYRHHYRQDQRRDF